MIYNVLPTAIVLLVVSTVFSACLMTDPSNYSTSSNLYSGKYETFLDSNEVEINSWYHYVTSQRSDDKYILRVFFPETQQITGQTEYHDRALQSKEGPATYWYDNGHLKSKGVFKADEKAGPWKHFEWDQGTLCAEGIYNNGKREGLWTFYHIDGWICEKTIYQEGIKHGRFMQYDSLLEITNEGIYQQDTVLEQSNRTVNDSVIELPTMLACADIVDLTERKQCSDQTLLTAIYKSVYYPAKAQKYGIEGKTVTRFKIDEEGNVEDIEVMTGLNEDIRQECIRVVKNLPAWAPGQSNGKNVRVQFNLPIVFKLE